MLKLIEKANILMEALPYIKLFKDKKFVIKIGGHSMVDDSLRMSIIEDISLLYYVGIKLTIIHGGGPKISEMLKQLGKKSTFVDGLRVTDEETMPIIEMVLTGNLNKDLVSKLNQHECKAVGISGKDGNLINAKIIKHKKKDIGFVGEVCDINIEILKVLENSGFIPVISPVAVDKNSNTININADDTAAAIAQTLHADKLILITDVDGVYKKNSKKIISSINSKDIRKLIKNKTVTGGMIPKIKTGINALKTVNKIHIINGTVKHSLLLELFTQKGIGTQIIK